MHTIPFIIAVLAVTTSALIAPPPPQITPPPPLPAILEPNFNNIHRRIQVENNKDLYSYDRDEIACFLGTYQSIIATDYPRPAPGPLASWSRTASLTTISDISEADAACTNTDYPAAPASLASSHSVYQAEVSSWRDIVHDAVHSIALRCGRVGPAFDALIARDEAECRVAFSAWFGLTAGSPSSTMAEPSYTFTGVILDDEVTSTVDEYFSRATVATRLGGSSPDSTGAAVRHMETGFMVAAMAGVAGVFAAL